MGPSPASLQGTRGGSRQLVAHCGESPAFLLWAQGSTGAWIELGADVAVRHTGCRRNLQKVAPPPPREMLRSQPAPRLRLLMMLAHHRGPRPDPQSALEVASVPFRGCWETAGMV